jgi:hypothetical protein
MRKWQRQHRPKAAISLKELLRQPNSPIDVEVCLEAAREMYGDLPIFEEPVLDEVTKSKAEFKGWVYLIRANKVFYKIGIARDVYKRIAQLQTGCPFEVTLVHLIPTTYPQRLEQGLHKIFEHKRLRGEWFALADADVKWICAFREST